MHKGRIEAFSDGVIAIIITIMVLEFKVPNGTGWESLRPMVPVFVGYALSFVFVGIYWNNHHHMFQAVQRINGKVLWANMHLLFWLSLIPFVTRWMEEAHFTSLPVAVYGFVLLAAGVAYYILSHRLADQHGKESILGKALGSDLKGKISLVMYLVAIPIAWVEPMVSCLIYVGVALLWFCPDQRIEKLI